jgi:hypothetical protein
LLKSADEKEREFTDEVVNEKSGKGFATSKNWADL